MEQVQSPNPPKEDLIEYTARIMGTSLERACEIVRIHHPNAYIGDSVEGEAQPQEENNGKDF